MPPDPHSTDPTQAEVQQILSLTVSPSEETLVAATERSQLYNIALSSAELSKGRDENRRQAYALEHMNLFLLVFHIMQLLFQEVFISYCLNLLTPGEQALFEPLVHSFHSEGVTGLDICIRKPLIATCSLDCSVRIWNYETKYVFFQNLDCLPC